MRRKPSTIHRLRFPSRFALAFLILVTLLLDAPLRAQDNPPPDNGSLLETIAQKYRIEIVTQATLFPLTRTYGIIEGKNPSSAAVKIYTDLFATEFAIYPTEFVRRSRLKRIVLCEDLHFSGQRRNAIPDFETDTLFLDCSRGAYNKVYQRKVIHHEFFHIIDKSDDGAVYKDPAWVMLNSPGFTYGSGGKNAQSLSNTSVVTEEFPGFLNHYSTTGVEEDKAELFANLIVDYTYVDGRAKKDTILAMKVVRLKELLARFSPDMSDTFWDKIRSLPDDKRR